MAATKTRPKPIVTPELCKACGRCIDACMRHCMHLGTETNQVSGYLPIAIEYDKCNGCGLCIPACPEPWCLTLDGYQLEEQRRISRSGRNKKRFTADIPERRIPFPDCEPMVLKGNYAAAIGAILSGCRHVFGYPITPSTEGAELMARLLPQLHGIFMQAISEVATVNHIYGCGGAGLPTMTFTSSPGFSLMLEGISYMIGAELPGVFINVMRPGPGLGFVGPEQSDIKLACRGLGHGNTHAIVLAPTTPQEMLQMTMLAFELTFKYRNPVVIAADGYLGQITGRVNLPDYMIEPGLPGWAVYGDAAHRDNLNSSILQDYEELEKHNLLISAKYRVMQRHEQRANLFRTEGVEILVVACNTPARTSKAAVEHLRGEQVSIGLFQVMTLWPFPIDALMTLLKHVQRIIVVEASDGQLEDEMRLALSHAGHHGVKIDHLQHMGGILPEEDEIINKVHAMMEVAP